MTSAAGYTWDAVIHRMSPKQWDAMLAVHVTAPFRLIQAAAPHMRDAAKREMQGGGAAKPRCIINVSSTSGTHGNAGQANYSTVRLTLHVPRHQCLIDQRQAWQCGAGQLLHGASNFACTKASMCRRLAARMAMRGRPTTPRCVLACVSIYAMLPRNATPRNARHGPSC